MRTTKKAETKATETAATANVETPVETAPVEKAEKTPAKETKKTTRKTTATKKSAAAKTTAAKRTTRKKAHVVNQEVYIQFWGKEVYAKDVVDRIKNIWETDMGRKAGGASGSESIYQTRRKWCALCDQRRDHRIYRLIKV